MFQMSKPSWIRRPSPKFQLTLGLSQRRRELFESSKIMTTPCIRHKRSLQRCLLLHLSWSHHIPPQNQVSSRTGRCTSCHLLAAFQHLQAVRRDCPQPSSFDSDITVWKLHMAEGPDTDTKAKLPAMCKSAQKIWLLYPNIHAILLFFRVFAWDLAVVSGPSVFSGVLRPGAIA